MESAQRELLNVLLERVFSRWTFVEGCQRGSQRNKYKKVVTDKSQQAYTMIEPENTTAFRCQVRRAQKEQVKKAVTNKSQKAYANRAEPENTTTLAVRIKRL